jgi:predicted acylesterase/phospholipase RssA
MLHSLATHGIAADMVVGSSVGSLNGAYYAGNPTLEGIERLETIWRGLRRSDVFPVSWGAMLGFLVRRNFLVEPHGLRMLIENNLTYRYLEDAKIPIHIVATNHTDRRHHRVVGGLRRASHHRKRCDPRRISACEVRGCLSRRRRGFQQHGG